MLSARIKEALVVAGLIACTALISTVPLSTLAMRALGLAFALPAAITIVVGVRRYRPRAKWAWYGWAAVAMMVALAVPLNVVVGAVFGNGIENLFSAAWALVSALISVASMAKLVKARLASWPAVVWLDSAILITGSSLLFWQIIYVDHVETWGHAEAASRLLVVIIPFALVAMLARLATTSGTASISFFRLTMAVAVDLSSVMIDVFLAPESGTFLSRLSESLANLLIVFIGLAAAHPGMRQLAEPVASHDQLRFGPQQIVLTGTMLAISPLTMILNGEHHDFPVLVWASASMLTLVLVVCRFTNLVAQYGASQRNLAIRSAHQSAVVMLGHRALDAVDIDALLADVVTTVRSTMDVDEAHIIDTGIVDGTPSIRCSAIAENTSGVLLHELVALSDLQRTLEASDADHVVIMGSSDIDVSVRELVALKNQVAGIVISGRARPFGALVVCSSVKRPFSTNEIDFLRSVSNVVASTVSRLTMEVEHRQTQKLEAVGRLGAGIAHEMNTPIQFISDNLTFLREAFNTVMSSNDSLRASLVGVGVTMVEDDVREDIEFMSVEAPIAMDQMHDGMKRLATIVQALKAFTTPEQSGSQLVDLNQAINNALTVAESQLSSIANVVFNERTIPPVMCEVGEVSQVLLHLLINAAHAIADGSPVGRKGLITVESSQEGDNVVIAVSDNGCGIPESIGIRVYDPFFTTKEVGRGSGQGLSIARNVMLNHGGEIDHVSSPDGTTFFLRFPVRESM